MMNLWAASMGFASGLLLGLMVFAVQEVQRRSSGGLNAHIAGIPVSTMAESTTFNHRSWNSHPIISVSQDTKAPERILCWIPVMNMTERVAMVANETFGRYCNVFYFVTKEGRLENNVIGHNYERVDRHDLWNQVHRGWTRIAEMHLNDYDWFVKLDWDSFFYADNFRYLVRRRGWDPEAVAYFGHNLFEQSRPVQEPRALFNAGAGYGVSRGLLRMIYPYFPTAVNSTIPPKKRCPEWLRWGEDVKFADCIRMVLPTLLPNRTRDEFDRETFNAFTPVIHFMIPSPPWYDRGVSPTLLRKQRALGCCSPRPILWHKATLFQLPLDYLQFQVAIDPVTPETMQPLAPRLLHPLEQLF